MNSTTGNFIADREWVLDKNIQEDIDYLDNCAKENKINRRRARTIAVMDIPNAQRDIKYKKYYFLYLDMLKRVYSANSLNKSPTYEFVTIERDLHIFSNFYSFITSLYKEDNWQLDKDYYFINKPLLEKQYSIKSIIFLPQSLNTFFTDANASRGDLPIFINKNGNRLRVRIGKKNQIFKSFSYGKYSSKEECLFNAFSYGINEKIIQIEKAINLVYKHNEKDCNAYNLWKKSTLSGLERGIIEFKSKLDLFNPENYSLVL